MQKKKVHFQENLNLEFQWYNSGLPEFHACCWSMTCIFLSSWVTNNFLESRKYVISELFAVLELPKQYTHDFCLNPSFLT